MKMQFWAINTVAATNRNCHTDLEIKQRAGTTNKFQTILALQKVGFSLQKPRNIK